MAAVINLNLRTGLNAALEIPAVGKARASFVKSFFTNSGNQVSSFLRKSSGTDKVIKVAAASSDLAAAIATRTGASGEMLEQISTAQSAFSGARTVLGLFNAYNGAIPATVDAVKQSVSLVKSLHKQDDVYSSAPKGGRVEGGLQSPYNQVYVGRTEKVLGLGAQVCKGVGSGTYALSFGVLRTGLFANKIGGFMSSDVKTGFGKAFDVAMCANHAAGFSGSIFGLAYEKMAYQRAKKACNLEDARGAELRSLLDRAHRSVVVGHILTLFEKTLDLILDFFKLIPTIATLLPAEAKAALGILIGSIGVYKIWRTS